MSKPSPTRSRIVAYGYRLAGEGWERENTKPDDSRDTMDGVVLDPITSKAVSRIFHDFEAGHSVRQIAVALATERYPSLR